MQFTFDPQAVPTRSSTCICSSRSTASKPCWRSRCCATTVIKRDRGEASAVKLSGDERRDKMPWPAEVIVVAQRYAREPPNAAELFEDPHRQIAGGRILSRWFAAQLIDSALYRGIAACDRLAIYARSA